jgi:hypothetical protein
MTQGVATLPPCAGSPGELQWLRGRVDELEELLGLKEPIEFNPFTSSHKVRVRTVARLLLARELVSKTAIILGIGGEDISDAAAGVYICYCRKHLAANGITIHTLWGRGWYIDAADKKKLRAVLTERRA